MLKPFLITFDAAQINRQALLDFLDTRSEVKNWFAFLPTAIFVISDHSAQQLAEAIRTGKPGISFVITAMPDGKNDGWLGKNVWEFINNPRSSGRWEP